MLTIEGAGSCRLPEYQQWSGYEGRCLLRFPQKHGLQSAETGISDSHGESRSAIGLNLKSAPNGFGAKSLLARIILAYDVPVLVRNMLVARRP